MKKIYLSLTATLVSCIFMVNCSYAQIASFWASSGCNATDTVTFSNYSSGATTYFWDFGDGGTSTLMNPTHNYSSAGIYSVMLVAADIDSDTSIQDVIVPAGPYSISGQATIDSAGAENALITLYYDNGSVGQWTVLTTTYADYMGYYYFDGGLLQGNYIIMADPDTLMYPNAIPTYYMSTHRWDLAEVVNAGCYDEISSANISIVSLPPLTGTSDLSGTMQAAVKKADPVPGVNISLEQVPGSVVASDKTDNDGNFSFTNVPQGNFTLRVSIPGMEMTSTYNIDLTSDDSTIAGLDFAVGDSTIIATGPGSTGKEIIIANLFNIKIYPNPYKEFTTFEYTLEKENSVTIEVYNMLGELVFSEQEKGQAAGTYKTRFSAKELGEAPGVYTAKIKVGNNVYSTSLLELR
ncbi:MAG: carboxypeptidase regulatory-like domain-containing protein [Bacteroidota bacterium]